MHRRRPGALACGLVVLAALSLSAADYVVAPGGDDGGPGTVAQPWATLQHAADTVAAGDTVLVRAGSYTGFQLTTSGSQGQPITFRAWPGEAPSIVADNPSTPDGINLEGASWVVVEGFEVDGRSRAGIRAVLCEHVTLRGNSLDANHDWGILTGFCDDLLIEANEASNSVVEHGIYVSNSGDRPVIRDNRIRGNHANGIHMNGDASLGGDGVITGALVEGNVIWDVGAGGGSGINMDGVQASTVRNNLIWDAHASGISLYRIDGGGPSSGNLVEHNTVVVASDGRWALNIQDDSSQNTVRNNVLYSLHGFRGAMSVCSPGCLVGFTSDGNALEDVLTLDDGDSILTLAAWRAATGQDAASTSATPAELFVAPGSDHHLTTGSPALDLGLPLADVREDLEGTPRPLGDGWDAGALEGVGVIFGDAFERGGTGRWSAAVGD